MHAYETAINSTPGKQSNWDTFRKYLNAQGVSDRAVKKRAFDAALKPAAQMDGPSGWLVQDHGKLHFISSDGRKHGSVAALVAHEKVLQLLAGGKYVPVEHTMTHGRGPDSTSVTRKVFTNPHDFEGGVPSYVDRNRVHDAILSRLDAGATNKQLMAEGKAPIGSDGRQVELHHVLGAEPGPMIELLASTHDKHHRPLHGLVDSSFRNDSSLENQYDAFRRVWWMQRSNDY
jgi:hypothetical protein